MQFMELVSNTVRWSKCNIDSKSLFLIFVHIYYLVGLQILYLDMHFVNNLKHDVNILVGFDLGGHITHT
jgi:hypothetical protein